jgi:hypothetical protein
VLHTSAGAYNTNKYQFSVAEQYDGNYHLFSPRHEENIGLHASISIESTTSAAKNPKEALIEELSLSTRHSNVCFPSLSLSLREKNMDIEYYD